MFRFAVTRGMLDASPFVALGRPGGSERARNRRLSDKEIWVFWKKLTRARLSAEVRIALKLILVTVQRPGEVALAAWNEFDLNGVGDGRIMRRIADEAVDGHIRGIR
jgi:integrase